MRPIMFVSAMMLVLLSGGAWAGLVPIVTGENWTKSLEQKPTPGFKVYESGFPWVAISSVQDWQVKHVALVALTDN